MGPGGYRHSRRPHRRVEPDIEAEAGQVVDAGGCLVSPPFVDPHFHMDATLSYGMPRINRSGTLLEGIALWGELKPLLTHEAVKERALAYCDWAVSHGPARHPQPCRHLRRPAARRRGAAGGEEGGRPISTCSSSPSRRTASTARRRRARTLIRALDMGVEVVGGIPHFERTMDDGRRSVTELCEIAAERGLRVDMHCDETDDPMSRHVEQLAYETQRLGLQGRVNGSHLTSMHSMDNYYVSKLLPLMAEAEVSAVPNPLINIVIQGRHDTYPKRRGMTRVPEMLAHGINASASARIACSIPGIRSARPTCWTSPSWACTWRR
jgi:cytosine/creatinine deaminase